MTTPPTRRLLQCVERHEERDPAALARKSRAWASWDSLYQAGVIPCHYREYKRDARNIGDKRALPYLKDVLWFAMDQAADEDIVFFSNDDNVLHPSLPAALKFHVAVYGACSSQRCDFRGTMPKLDQPPSEFARRGAKHIGRDLFAFTKAWLVAKWDELPDFILGASDFDLALACMIRLEKGVISTRKNIEDSIWPCELERGLVSHVHHNAAWRQPRNIDVAPSQRHNRALFKAWASKRMPSLKFNAGDVI